MADPSLAWIKQAELQGDIDWRQVKEIHDPFKYSHSWLGAGAQLVLAIVMAAFVGPVAMGALTTAGASTAVAAGGPAVASSAATTAASSFISNQGNLGGVLRDTFSGTALRGYAVSGLTAGLTVGVYDGWTGTETGPGSVANTGGNGSGILSNSGHVGGASLNTWTGVGRFAANQALQNSTSAVLSKLLGQPGSIGDALRNGLANTFAAAGFNLVGNVGFANQYAPGSAQMVGLHALMGGLAAVAAGGDFKAGALAAGASEALVATLDKQFSSLDDAKRQNLLTMTSQLVGVAAAAVVDEGDGRALQTGASVAQSGVQYNYLSDHQKQVRDKELADCPSATCRLATSLKWEAADLQQDLGLVTGVGGGIGLSVADTAQGLYELVTHFSEVKEALNQLRTSPEFRQQFSDAYLSSLEQRANMLTQAYNDAGWEGSVTAGVLAGQFASDLVGVLTAVRGAAAITAKLPEATVKLLNAVVVRPSSAPVLTFGRKLDFLFNKNINQANAYNANRAAGNASRIGIADTPENRAEVTRLFNEAYSNPASIVGPGKIPGSNLREFFLPGITSTGSKIQFVEKDGVVITIIAR